MLPPLRHRCAPALPAVLLPPPEPATLGPEPWPQRLLRTHVAERWRRIDAQEKTPRVGRVSARTAAVVTAIVAAVMVTFLRFTVMDRAVQVSIATLVEVAGAALHPSLGDLLRRQHLLLINLTWVTGCFTCYFAVPGLVVHHVFGARLADFYLAPRAYFRHLPVYMVLFLPVGLLVALAARNPEFLDAYPFYAPHQGWLDLAVWELGYAVQFLSLEFFFRGFLLKGFGAEMGSMAIVAMVTPYCMIHFGKPLPECLGSVVAGLVLGTLAMQTRSIWGGVTIHVAVAWSMDGAAVWQKASLGR